MKRQAENINDGESSKRREKSMTDICAIGSLSQDNYNVIFEQTRDFRSLFPLLFVARYALQKKLMKLQPDF
jgi:hypothetical protein